MRMRKKPWAAKELEDNPRIIHDPSVFAHKMPEYFNNNQPIHLELGCGKGRFITQTATRHPEINHLAIERDATAMAVTARLSRGIDSPLGLLVVDVEELPEYFLPGQIKRLYINFCDPWPRKKKWAKRRLTHVNFLEMYENLEIPEIFFKTDNRILFEFSINQFSERGWIMRNISLDLHNSGFENNKDNIMTEYEEKFSPHGPIYRMEAYLKPKI